ncbi:phosphotyrosine-specific ptp2-like protein, partial [Basidiobolus ranarum]
MTIGFSYKPSHISLPDTSFFTRSAKSPSKVYSTNPIDSPIISPLASSPCGSGVKGYFPTHESQQSHAAESMPRFNFPSMQTARVKSTEKPPVTTSANSGSNTNNSKIVTPETLANLIQQDTREVVLVIDKRSYAQYSLSHIRCAINVCIPNTLLKRASFGLEKVAESLVAEKDREILQNWTSYSNIIVCDSTSEATADNTPIAYLTKKFYEKNPSTSVGWLKGGFDTFQSKFPNLCDESVQIQTTKSSPSPSSFLAAPLTCPTPSASSTIMPFFNNIRPHHEVTCELGEIVAIRTPSKPSKLNIEIPAFISEVSYNPQGKYKLSQTFKCIDKVEQKRLQSLLVPQTHPVCQSNPYSIAAGVERGSKNRYNNIWPYEHSRVKLQHPDIPDSDYINASFICDKDTLNQYIATQGPMPSTFADFWEMTWEQNSRVIVMLT